MMEVIRKEIKTTPDKTTDFIVSEMWRLSNRDSKAPIIIKRAKSLKGKSKSETLKNIYDYVIKKVPYVKDPDDREQITAPIHLENGNKVGGDCDCQVTLLSALLTAAGIENRIMTIAWRLPQFTHVVLEAKTGLTWKVLDPTRGKNGFGKTIPTSMDKVKRRLKRYKKPMIVETLNDGCGCSSQLSDCSGGCGCGGKCGGKKRHHAKNHNNNINNIVIGNDLLQKTDFRMNRSDSKPKSTFPRIISNEEIEPRERKQITLKKRGRGQTKRLVSWTVPQGPFY